MKTRLHQSRKLSLSLPVLLALAVPAVMHAQAATDNAAPEETIYNLDAFTVNTGKDNGYTAIDSLAGGRQNTPIRLTPATMSSITREFINDLNITNVQDVLRWSLNTLPTSWRNGMSGGSGGDVFNYWSVSIRGDSHVQGGNPPTKNYFPTFRVLDAYNLDRVEIDGGPNSILFGIGDIGGSMTSYSKQALIGKNTNDVQLSTTSYGGYRFTVDTNQSAGKAFALRLNAVMADERGWHDGDIHKKFGVDLAGTWKLGSDTQVRFELEGMREKKSVFSQTFQDQISLWNGSTSSATWGSSITNSGASPISTSGAPGVKGMEGWAGTGYYQVWVPGVGLMNWGGGARSMGTNDVAWGAYMRPYSFTYGPTSGTVIAALPSKDWAITPTDGVLKQNALDLTVAVDHRLTDCLDLNLSAYQYVDDSKAKNFEGAGWVAYDLNKQLPNGATNPNYGKKYSDFFLDAQTQNHAVTEFRGQLSYHVKGDLFGVPIKELVSLSAGQQATKYDARQYQAQYWNGYDENNWTRTMIWGRIYWDQPQTALNIPETYNGKQIKYTALPFNWYDFDSKQTIKFAGLYSATNLWDDRLNISAGIRRDTYSNWKHGLRGPSNPTTLADGSGNTYSIGAVGYLTEWLGVYANMSENYQPAAGGLAPSIFGATYGPSFGKGKNAGIRISTKDGKYNASLGYYNDRSVDVIGGDSPDFQGIWNNYFEAGGTNTNIGPAGNVTGTSGNYHANMNYVDTYDVKYTGMEFELTASPTKNFRIQAHYSVPKGEKTNDGPNAAAYYAKNISTWQAVASGSSAAATKLASSLTQAKNNIDAVSKPVTTGHLIKYMANVFGVYSFTEGILEGFEVGGGASALGKQYGNPWDTVNGERSLSPGYTTYSGMLAYTTHFGLGGHKVRTKLQLNVDNLFGKDTLIFMNYQSYGSGQAIGMDYNMVAPRKLTFSANFQF